MILHVASDIHFEFMNQERRDRFWGSMSAKVAEDKPEGIVLAGDIGSIDRNKIFKQFDLFLALYPKVVYTPGNHEFFGTSIFRGHQALGYYVHSQPDFQLILPTTPATLGGTTFSGGTMWYPDCGDIDTKLRFIDYDRIDDSHVRIEKEHQDFLAHEPGKVVVSHHFPTDESIHEVFKRADNTFFCAYIDQTLMEWERAGKLPKLWIHGHTHYPFDVQSRFGFRIYCNPGGYPNEGTNPNFFNRLKVEVP